MTLQQLSYLLEVHKAGSFSQAARNLYITQAAVSNAVSSLEKELGATIFIRNQYGLTLTPRGEEVIVHATRICESMQFLTTPHASQKKALRISSNRYPPIQRAFTRLLAENQHRNDIDFSFTSGSGIPGILSHETDIVFYFRLNSYSQGVEESMADQGLCYEEFLRLPAVIAIGPKHPLYSQPEIQMQELRNYRLVDASKHGVSNARVLSAYLPVKKDKIIYANGIELRKQLIEEGLAYNIQPLPGKTDHIADFRYMPIEGLSFTFYCVTNPSFPRTPELERYLEIVKEEIAAEYAGFM